jgi:hypothetical protein
VMQSIKPGPGNYFPLAVANDRHQDMDLLIRWTSEDINIKGNEEVNWSTPPAPMTSQNDPGPYDWLQMIMRWLHEHGTSTPSWTSGTNVGFYHKQDSPRCMFLYALSLEFITDRFNRQPRVKWVVWYIIHLYCTATHRSLNMAYDISDDDNDLESAVKPPSLLVKY